MLVCLSIDGHWFVASGRPPSERPRATLPCHVSCSGNAPALLGGHAMIKITSLPTIAGALLALGLSAAPAQAGPNRTWVSGRGTDAGGCPVTAPCRTFAFALTQTAAGGQIDVLDPAGYGTVYKSGFDPTVNVRLRHSFNGGHYRRRGPASLQAAFAEARAAGGGCTPFPPP